MVSDLFFPFTLLVCRWFLPCCYTWNLDLCGFFLLGLLLKDCFLPPANNSDSRLGFRNGVPTVAHHAMPHLLVTIKLSFGTFLLGYGFLEHLGRCQTP